MVKFFRRLKPVAFYGDASRKQKPLTAAFDDLGSSPKNKCGNLERGNADDLNIDEAALRPARRARRYAKTTFDN